MFTVSRSATLSFEGHYLVDETTGARDSGQFLLEQSANGFGPDSYRFVKIEAVNTARTVVLGHIIIQASVKNGDQGGGMEDIAPFNVECMAIGSPVGSGVYNRYGNTLLG